MTNGKAMSNGSTRNLKKVGKDLTRFLKLQEWSQSNQRKLTAWPKHKIL